MPATRFRVEAGRDGTRYLWIDFPRDAARAATLLKAGYRQIENLGGMIRDLIPLRAGGDPAGWIIAFELRHQRFVA